MKDRGLTAADGGDGASSLPSPALQRLLDAAKLASPNERIQWRDPIASHGDEAIPAVAPWLADRVLAAFAVRVVLRAGEHGDREEAIRVLRKARRTVPLFVRVDVNAAIRQLQHPSLPDVSKGSPEVARARLGGRSRVFPDATQPKIERGQ